MVISPIPGALPVQLRALVDGRRPCPTGTAVLYQLFPFHGETEEEKHILKHILYEEKEDDAQAHLYQSMRMLLLMLLFLADLGIIDLVC